MAAIWTGMVLISILCGLATGNGGAVGAAALEGAGAAVDLCLAMAGVLCLWMGVMEIMKRSGLSAGLSRLLRPLLARLYPEFAGDKEVMDSVSANVSANLLGLGNAATPMGINAVLDGIDDAVGDQEDRDIVKAEALTLRAFGYFMLVNLYGEPYNYNKEALGVPLKLATGVTDDHLERGTVAGVYDQIVSDMKQGIALMQVGVDYEPSDIERLNRVASWGLLSRVYLHMEDWESVINYADSVLTEYSSLQTLEPGEYGVYSPSGDLVEVLWASLEAEDDNMQTILSPYGPSEDLYNCFREDIKNNVGRDIRGVTSNDDYYRAAYIHENAADDDDDAPEGLYCVLKSVTSDNWYNAGIRTAEVYLNRAEAYIRLYMEDGDETKAQRALDDLNDLRRTRFENGYEDWLVSDFETPEELLDFCLRERRRELCVEANTRWFDLRRTGMPRIVHTYVDNSSGVGQDYILEERDTRYVLPIPGSVAERNPNLRK